MIKTWQATEDGGHGSEESGGWTWSLEAGFLYIATCRGFPYSCQHDKFGFGGHSAWAGVWL